MIGACLKICMSLTDEGSFVNLQHKHNFTMAHFGMMLGLLCRTLQGTLASIDSLLDLFACCSELPLHVAVVAALHWNQIQQS